MAMGGRRSAYGDSDVELGSWVLLSAHEHPLPYNHAWLLGGYLPPVSVFVTFLRKAKQQQRMQQPRILPPTMSPIVVVGAMPSTCASVSQM